MKCWNPECSNVDLSPKAITCPACGWDKPKARPATYRPPPLPRHDPGAAPVVARTVAAARDFSKAQKDPRAWAKTIVREVVQGRHYPTVSFPAALEALGMLPDVTPVQAYEELQRRDAQAMKPLREPGQEG